MGKRRINLNEITEKEPTRVRATFQPSLLELPKEEVSKASPFEIDVEVKKQPVGYRVKGKIKGEVELTCSRCLKKFSQEVEKEFDYELMPTSYISGGEIKGSELDVKFSDEESLDLPEVISEQISLELPLKPLCGSKECEESISYTEEEGESDERWSKLAALKNKLIQKEKSDGCSKEEGFKNEKG
jgi:uncharacterized protein